MGTGSTYDNLDHSHHKTAIDPIKCRNSSYGITIHVLLVISIVREFSEQGVTE